MFLPFKSSSLLESARQQQRHQKRATESLPECCDKPFWLNRQPLIPPRSFGPPASKSDRRLTSFAMQEAMPQKQNFQNFRTFEKRKPSAVKQLLMSTLTIFGDVFNVALPSAIEGSNPTDGARSGPHGTGIAPKYPPNEPPMVGSGYAHVGGLCACLKWPYA